MNSTVKCLEKMIQGCQILEENLLQKTSYSNMVFFLRDGSNKCKIVLV